MDSSDSEFESALRKAEGIVAEAFMDAFPKHYMISQRIFSVPEDTEPFLRKLGRFLLDYDQELGASPAAALADGRSDLLLKVLANRSSIDPESIGFYPEITDGCKRAWNFRSCLAALRRILGLWNRSMYSNTSARAASSVGYFMR